MRVLLTNNTLAARAGSELYAYDVALQLLRLGHEPIAFSTVHGDVAEQMRGATIPVIRNLDDCGEPPDIIHGHHHFETLTASLYFPNSPVVNFCHGWLPTEEEPVISPRVLRYVAVDDVCRDRLLSCFGVDSNKIVVLLNFVDTDRFRRRSPLPATPRRALAFGNYFTAGDQLSVIETVCRDAGMQLDIVGLGNNFAVEKPEEILPKYDVVFAKARAALEAMAVGTAVILAGPRGFGPMVTSANWVRLRRLNFGVRALTLPVSTDAVASQLRLYDAGDAADVSDLVRSQATLADSIDQLLALYGEVIEEFRTSRPDPGEAQKAAARHLTRYASMFKAFSLEYANTPGRRDPQAAEILGRVFGRKAAHAPTPESGIVATIDSAIRQYGVMIVFGWVAHVPSKQPCTAVLFFQGDECIGVGSHVPRADVNDYLKIPGISFGFQAHFNAGDGPVRVLAVMASDEVFDISSFAFATSATQNALRGLP